MMVGTRYGERPPRSYETGAVTKMIRIAAVALTAASIITALVLFPSLPETIPTHFGPSGEADGWGPRGTIFGLLAISAVVVGGMTVLSRYPRTFNYLQVITEANAQQAYREGERTIVWTTASCALLFASITFASVFQVNLGLWFLPGALGVLASCVIGIVRMTKV